MTTRTRRKLCSGSSSSSNQTRVTRLIPHVIYYYYRLYVLHSHACVHVIPQYFKRNGVTVKETIAAVACENLNIFATAHIWTVFFARSCINIFTLLEATPRLQLILPDLSIKHQQRMPVHIATIESFNLIFFSVHTPTHRTDAYLFSIFYTHTNSTPPKCRRRLQRSVPVRRSRNRKRPPMRSSSAARRRPTTTSAAAMPPKVRRKPASR